MAASLDKEQLARLKHCTDPLQLAGLLQAIQQDAPDSPAILKSYHDQLLFYTAFPASKKIYQLANAGLKRIATAVHEIYQGNNFSRQNSLSGSGIAHSQLLCGYSLAMTRWLVHHYPDDVGLGGSDATPAAVIAVLQVLLPDIEFEKTTQRELSLTARIQSISGLRAPASQLKWLISLFETSSLDETIQEILYQQLAVFIQWKLDHHSCNRTFLKLPVKKIWLQTSFLTSVDSNRIIREPLEPMKLTAQEKKAVTNTVKASLAFYCRETDPFTYAEDESAELVDLGRGVQIALISLQPGKRLSLESYIGFMAFKNGVPVAYGGGWMWGQRCKIGVNIYPPFRKGESAWLFCQVLRTYYQQYGARHFIVRPYQFGHSNPEGIRSGAFWFYYKLGFRPAHAHLQTLAGQEWEKKTTQPHYRTTEKMLKQFTAANLEWKTIESAFPSFGADELSAVISKQINTCYSGSREKAILAAGKQLKKCLPPAAIKIMDGWPEKVKVNFILLCGFIPDLHEWNKSALASLVHCWKIKVNGSERNFMLQLQKHKRLWASLNKVMPAAHSSSFK